MSRKRTKLAFSVRYREPNGKTKNKLIFTTSPGRAGSVANGKVLGVSKVSQEEILKVGEFNDIPSRLMEEFRKESKRNGHDKNLQEVLSYG